MIPYAMAQPFLTKQIIIHQPFLQCAAVYSKSFRNLIKASSSGIALLRCMDFHFRTDQCRNDAPRVVRKFFSLCLLYGEHSKPCLALLVQRIESPIYHPFRWFRRGFPVPGQVVGQTARWGTGGRFSLRSLRQYVPPQVGIGQQNVDSIDQEENPQ